MPFGYTFKSLFAILLDTSLCYLPTSNIAIKEGIEKLVVRRPLFQHLITRVAPSIFISFRSSMAATINITLVSHKGTDDIDTSNFSIAVDMRIYDFKLLLQNIKGWNVITNHIYRPDKGYCEDGKTFGQIGVQNGETLRNAIFF